MTTKEIVTGVSDKSLQALKSVKRRALSKTSPKNVKWRNIGLIIAGIGGAILTAPISLPAVLISAAPIMVWGGNVVAGIAHMLDS